MVRVSVHECVCLHIYCGMPLYIVLHEIWTCLRAAGSMDVSALVRGGGKGRGKGGAKGGGGGGGMGGERGEAPSWAGRWEQTQQEPHPGSPPM